MSWSMDGSDGKITDFTMFHPCLLALCNSGVISVLGTGTLATALFLTWQVS